MTARAKPHPSAAKVDALFLRFARSGYRYTLFTQPLYHALMYSFGFIAHFDRGGFYEARFAALPDRVETLRTMGVEVLGHTLTELETALRESVLRLGLLDRAVEAMRADTEARERVELARLRAKYEPEGRAP
jgi:hypothetical protein